MRPEEVEARFYERVSTTDLVEIVNCVATMQSVGLSGSANRLPERDKVRKGNKLKKCTNKNPKK